MSKQPSAEEKYYGEQMVKLIATRFAKASRDKQDVTSNDTITHFEQWILEHGDNFKSIEYFKQQATISTLTEEVNKLTEERDRLKESNDRVKSYYEDLSKEIDVYKFKLTNVPDNSDKFHEWLDIRNIEWKANGHFTTIIGNHNFFSLGELWGKFYQKNRKGEK